MSEFKKYDEIYVMDIKINDIIMNSQGYFIRELNSGINKDCYLVQVNETIIAVDKKKVLTQKQFSDEMKLRNELKNKQGE